MAGSTREALLEQGALLFARHGVHNVTTRQLHEAVGARNESALHYHFGGRDGLVEEIVRVHLEAVESRRAVLVDRIRAQERSGDLRALVHALAAPMADDLQDPLGRAHLRLVAQLSHPSLAYERPFRVVEAPAGTTIARWLRRALAWLPAPVRSERAAVLRAQLIALFAMRAQLVDELPGHDDHRLFVENLLDMLVAGLEVEPSPATAQSAASSSASTILPSALGATIT